VVVVLVVVIFSFIDHSILLCEVVAKIAFSGSPGRLAEFKKGKNLKTSMCFVKERD